MKGRVEAENREFTAAELAKVDAITAKFDATEAELRAVELELVEAQAEEERVLDLEMRLAQAGSRRVVPPAPLRGSSGAQRPYDLANKRHFVDMFAMQADPYGGAFKSLRDLCRAALAGNDARLMVSNAAMTEGTGVDGGYLVPEQWAFGMMDQALAKEAVRPRALTLPMSTNVLNVPGFDYQDGTGAKRAGLLMTWGGEAQTLTEQAGKTRTVGLVAKKATILVRVSSELLEDAGAFDTSLYNAMSAAVQIGLDVAFFQGTGAGQPLGILNSPATITVAKESSPSQPANTIWVQNLANMLSRLSPSSYGSAVWFVHPTCVPALLQLTVAVYNLAGTDVVGGSTAGLVTQNNGVLQIAGKEVIVTEACSPFSSAGDVILADLSQYAVGMRRDISIMRSDHVYLTTDEVAFRLRLRCDGQPLASAATKLRDGSNTVSPFVILGAR
jgi:HK97 family phage major capsid protein